MLLNNSDPEIVMVTVIMRVGRNCGNSISNNSTVKCTRHDQGIRHGNESRLWVLPKILTWPSVGSDEL